MGGEILHPSIFVLPSAKDQNVVQGCAIYGSTSSWGAFQKGWRDHESVAGELPSGTAENSEEQDDER